MRPSLMSVAALVLTVVLSPAGAETKAELLSSTRIWEFAPRNLTPDLIRFKDRWFLVCQESTGRYSQDGTLRVLTSKDGRKWEVVTLIPSPTSNKSLFQPRFSLTAEGQLLLSANGVVPTPGSSDPLPEFGGTVNTMAWTTKDGRTWSESKRIGKNNFPFGGVVSHKKGAMSYACGCICGSMQTVQLFSGKDSTSLKSIYERTFSDFFPGNAAVIVRDNKAHCLMSRFSVKNSNRPIAGYLGTSKSPYTEWEWRETNVPLVEPSLLHLPDGRILVTAGLADKKPRTSLCELDAKTGKLTELLTLPTDGTMDSTGLAHHQGEVWISYHATQGDKPGIHVARVKLK